MWHITRTIVYISLLFSLACLVAGCDVAVIDPKGWVGKCERDLLYLSLGLMLIVIVPVLFMTGYFFWKYREKQGSEYLPDWEYSGKIESVIWIIPIAIIGVLATITWYSTHDLDPYKPLDHKKEPLVIQVISMDWKWLFIYPDYNIATVSELVFPVNQPVAFQITSDTVMSSFFIPRLGSQIYTMAGMETKLHLLADQPGEYKGVCTGYSGYGFSDMKFNTVVTGSQGEFEEWVQRVRGSSLQLQTQGEFQQLANPTHGYPITYFASVKPGLFRETINKYMDMSNHDHGHGCNHCEE